MRLLDDWHNAFLVQGCTISRVIWPRMKHHDFTIDERLLKVQKRLAPLLVVGAVNLPSLLDGIDAPLVALNKFGCTYDGLFRGQSQPTIDVGACKLCEVLALGRGRNAKPNESHGCRRCHLTMYYLVLHKTPIALQRRIRPARYLARSGP